MSKRFLVIIALAPILFADWAFAESFLQEQTNRRKAEFRSEQQRLKNVSMVRPQPKIKQTINPTRESRKVDYYTNVQQQYGNHPNYDSQQFQAANRE